MYIYSSSTMKEIRWETDANVIELQPDSNDEQTLYINENIIASTSEELEKLLIILKDAKQILELQEAKNGDDN